MNILEIWPWQSWEKEEIWQEEKKKNLTEKVMWNYNYLN